MAEGAGDEPIVIQATDNSGSGISDVLPLLKLDVVGVTSAGYPLRGGGGAAVWAEERFPVVCYAKDEVCTFEGFDEGRDIVEVCLHDLDAG